MLPEAPTPADYKQDCSRASCTMRTHNHTQAMICNNMCCSERARILAHGPVPSFVSLHHVQQSRPAASIPAFVCRIIANNNQLGLYLPCVVLLKAGNLLYKAIGGENCMQCLHIYRIRLILYLHTKHSNHNGVFFNTASSAAITQEFCRFLKMHDIKLCTAKAAALRSQRATVAVCSL